MTKEYKWIADEYMTPLITVVNKNALKGWRLVNVFSSNKFYIAVLERDKEGGEK